MGFCRYVQGGRSASIKKLTFYFRPFTQYSMYIATLLTSDLLHLNKNHRY